MRTNATLRHICCTVLAVVATATSIAALSTPAPKFAEIGPLKAAMLTKQWQGLLLDVDQKVGIVPELGSTSVGVKRFGPELERRTLCKRQFEEFYESTFALAIADKNNPPDVARSKRSTVPGLAIDGRARGPDCTCFASLTSPATIALVERLENEWSVLALTVNPTERDIGTIVAAELAMLAELRARAAGASLMVLAKAKDTLAGDPQRLGLTPLLANEGADVDADADEPIWFRCEA